MAVRPVFVRVTEEEVLAGDDEDFAFFQAFVEFLGGDRQAGKPEPEEQRALAAVHEPVDVVAEGVHRGLAGEPAFFLVERAHHLAAEAQDLAGLDQRQGDLLADVRVGEAGDGAHRAERADDFRRADDDAGAGAGQAEFREAERQNHVRLPERRGVGEDDAGEGRAIGVVDDERDVVLLGDGGEAGDFLVGEDVAGGIGRARGADRGDVGGDFELVEIDAVFELVRAGFFDQRGDGAEQVAAGALVGVADVFGDEREQDFAAAAVGHRSGEQVEEEIEGGLAAAGDADVLRAELPAEGLAEEGGDGLDEMRISARRVVGGERALEAAHFLHDFLKPPPPDGVDLGDAGGLAAAEHFQVRAAAGEGVAEVVHQLADSAAAAELPTKL